MCLPSVPLDDAVVARGAVCAVGAGGPRIMVVERGLAVGDGRDVGHAVERAGVHGRGGLGVRRSTACRRSRSLEGRSKVARSPGAARPASRLTLRLECSVQSPNLQYTVTPRETDRQRNPVAPEPRHRPVRLSE